MFSRLNEYHMCFFMQWKLHKISHRIRLVEECIALSKPPTFPVAGVPGIISHAYKMSSRASPKPVPNDSPSRRILHACNRLATQPSPRQDRKHHTMVGSNNIYTKMRCSKLKILVWPMTQNTTVWYGNIIMVGTTRIFSKGISVWLVQQN